MTGRWDDEFPKLLSHPSDSLSLFLPIPLSLSPYPPSFEFFGENEIALIAYLIYLRNAIVRLIIVDKSEINHF